MDIDEWAYEGSRMAQIYTNAYLTIAASASHSGDQGLLNRRHTTRRLDIVQNDKSFAVWIRDIIRHEFLDDLSVPFWSATDLPLRKRAWCFQEELLSTRIVHFTKDEIVFVCRAATTCECDPRWQSRFQLPPIVGTSSESPCDIWNSVVKHYSERQISFWEDKLPALSSLTRHFEENGGNYFAGHWLFHMPGSLLWWSQRSKRPKQAHDAPSRPPSWSWASVEGAVHYTKFSDVQDVAKLLHMCIYPGTVDPRGIVSGGHMTLQAPLFPLRGVWKEQYSAWRYFLDNNNGDRRFKSCFAFSPGWASELRWPEEEDCYCVLDDPTSPPPLLSNRVIDTPMFLLVIRTIDNCWPHVGIPPPGGCGFLGLLLQPLEDLDDDQTKTMERLESKLSFVRIGFGGMSLSKEDGEEAMNRFKDTVVTIF